MTALTPDDLERFSRHILLKEIGGPGQQRLKAAHVAIVGLGGLGAPAAMYLAAAGVGKLTLIDDDGVSLSNLQRQILYRTTDVQQLKALVGRDSLAALNPGVEITPFAVELDAMKAERLLAGADVVLDGTDDFDTRFAVNAACHALGIPLVSGAVGRWDGQVGVFASGRTKDAPADQRLPCYRCFVPEEPPQAEHCSEVGVVGALTGVIGSMMALETIKIIARAGETLAGRVFLFDGLKAEARTVRLKPDPACPVCAR
ncbi:MAG: molybdopterin-synthase adenylyltransferase MoeB [Hyphomonadaceae bacterium]|nr:molybdopterin-synthase adenylyltransferase MoeB [Hyphomonadaceae bacterium]